MNRPSDTYLIFGDDEYLVDEALRRVIAHLRSFHGGDLVSETVDYREDGIAGFARELSSPSLFSENKATIVKHFNLSSVSKAASEMDGYVSRGLPDGQYLVLLPDKVDKRLRAVKTVAAKGGLIECNHISGEGLFRWIIDRFKEEGKNAGPPVAEALVDLKGENLRALDSEIVKAVTYAGEETKITRKDIEVLVGKSRTEQIFELVSRVVLRKPAEAIGILGELLDNNESPIGMVYLIAQEVRRLIILRLFLQEAGVEMKADKGFGWFKAQVLPRYEAFTEANGISGKDASLQRKPYFLYMRVKECGEFALADLITLLGRLAEANRLLVSSIESPRVVLEGVIAGMVTS
jgi:DNA polymerase-3 subunit delta